MQAQFEKMLAFYGAPTLAGIKTGSLISLRKREFHDVLNLINQYGRCLKCRDIFITKISESRDAIVVFIYRRQALRLALMDGQNQEILRAFGYDSYESIEEKLEYLKLRMQTEKTFPHEVGVFLGYPYEDIRGFMEHKGKFYKACGYWKVYSDVSKAEKLFQQYTQCSHVFCKRLDEGKSLLEILKVG